MFAKLACIAFVVVFIVDISGVVDSIKSALSSWLGHGTVKRLKPFDCSLCMTFWSGLIYLAASGRFSLMGAAVVCLLAYLTPAIKELLSLLMEVIMYIFRIVYKVIENE